MIRSPCQSREQLDEKTQEFKQLLEQHPDVAENLSKHYGDGNAMIWYVSSLTGEQLQMVNKVLARTGGTPEITVPSAV